MTTTRPWRRRPSTAAGFPDGFATTIHYSATPSAAVPDPGALVLEIQAELQTNLGITADLVNEPDSTYRADVDAGKIDGIHLLVQTPAYPDVSASLDPRFATRRDRRDRPALPGYHQSAGGRPGDGQRDQARGRLQEGERRHPRPRAAHPARDRRIGRGVPGRRQGCRRLAAAGRVVRPDDAGRSAPAGVADDPRADGPVLRRRGRSGRGADLQPGRREPVCPRPG